MTKNEFGKDAWVEMFRAVGLDEPAMLRWHAEFERMAPEAHQDFLESLRIPAAAAAAIRRRARERAGRVRGRAPDAPVAPRPARR